MTAIVANNPFRLSGGTGGIENVERIRCGDRNAFVGLCRLQDHRHVDDHAIAFTDTQARERSRKTGYPVAQFAVSERFADTSDRAVLDERWLIATALFNVKVEGVVTGVHFAANEPAIERLAAVVEHLVPFLVPVDCFRGFAPETGRVF